VRGEYVFIRGGLEVGPGMERIKGGEGLEREKVPFGKSCELVQL
jgi:hypothetical protein